MLNQVKRVRIAVPFFLSMMGVLLAANQASAVCFASWTLSRGDIHNTSHARCETDITRYNVKNLKVKWEYLTAPDAFGSVGMVFSAPSIAGKYLYFTDGSGYITALDRHDKSVLWKKHFESELSAPGKQMLYSRNTPVIANGKLIVGSHIHFASGLCAVDQKAFGLSGIPTGGIFNFQEGAFNCVRGDGAIVAALDRFTGNVLWRTKVSDHPAAKISGSVTVVGNTVYVPVGGWEEEFARRLPNIYDTTNANFPNEISLLPASEIDTSKPYPCCSAQGRVVALDLETGAIKWTTALSIGLDANNKLSNSLKASLGPKGFYGVSTYGENIPVDLLRDQIYVATTNSYVAPPIMEACELARRTFGIANPGNAELRTLPPPLNIQLPSGVKKCNGLAQSFKTYPNAVVALNRDTGAVKWSFLASDYDNWNHACDAPDLTVGTGIVPVLWPDPITNANNCPQVVGPDFGFGSQPILIKNAIPTQQASRKNDILVAGNKDGLIYGLNPSDGKPVWSKPARLSPGGLYGGIQFGMASDGKKIFAGTNNTHNNGRNINLGFTSSKNYIDLNFNNNPSNTSGVKIRVSKDHRFAGDPGTDRPSNSFASASSPFPAPNLVLSGQVPGAPVGVNFGAGYPTHYPLFDINNIFTGNHIENFLTGPTSGPKEVWKLIRPPSDVKSDCFNVFDRFINTANPSPDIALCVAGRTAQSGADLYTIAGMVSAVDAATGEVLWQRPAVDGIGATQGASGVTGGLTVANGLVFVGYSDGKGTMVALDSDSGELKFKFNAQVAIDNQGGRTEAGFVVGNPSIVHGKVYWGIGSDTFGPFNPIAAGNRVYAFELDPSAADNDDYEEPVTTE